MMRATAALLKTALNLNFGWSWIRETYLHRRQRLWEPLLILFALAVTGPVLLHAYVRVLSFVYDQGALFGQPAVVLTLAILIAQFIVLIFGLFWLMSAFYFANDLPQLVPLPLTPRAVLGSKFLQVAVNELLTVLLIVVPALAVYAARAGVGAGYWPVAILVTVLLPVIPLAAAGVLVILVMRVINVRRSRDLLTVLAGILALVFVIAVQYFAARVPDGHEAEYIRGLIAAKNGLILALGRRFPPSLWASRAIAAYATPAGLGQAVLLFGISGAILLLMFLAAQRLFYGGLLAGSGAVANKIRLTAGELGSAKAGGVVPALVRREWRLLLRTPVFLLQWLMSVLIFPILIAIWYLTKSKNMPLADLAARLPVHWLVLGGAAFLVMDAVLFQLAPTTFSREGKHFWISKMIPVAPADQMRAKQRQIWAATLLSFLPAVATIGLVLDFRARLLLPVVLLGLAGTYPLLNLGLLLDLIWPKLYWTNPQQAMKGNLNVLVLMLLGAGLLALLGKLAALGFAGGFSGPLLCLLLGLFMVFLGVVLDGVLRQLAEGRFRAIEM